MFLDCGYTSINKMNEQLCGDMVETARRGNMNTLVLCDGMGSGVKANILATLSSKILCTMIDGNVPIEECIQTLIDTLPVCKVRGVAYATFSVAHIDDEGKGTLIEFDNPPAILIRDGKNVELERSQTVISGKKVTTARLELLPNDTLFMMSDGAILAGVGKLMNFGWQRPEIIEFLERNLKPDASARAAACMLASACNDLYMDEPGDDTTILAVKAENRTHVSVFVGPPVDKSRDDFYVERFLSEPGKKIVCGGTSSQIVARHLKTQVATSLDFPDRDVPPIGFIKGIDLTTEGVITLRKLNEIAENYLSPSSLKNKSLSGRDGASLLAKLLFTEADSVTFYVGQNVNKAHEGQPIDITMKLKLIEKLAESLKKMGIPVELNYD